MKNSFYFTWKLLVCLFLFVDYTAQTAAPNCGQHILHRQMLSNPACKAFHTKAQQTFSQQTLSSNSKGVVYTIPVVFHVVHNNRIEKIDRSQALDALAILNRDLRALRADTATVDSIFKPLIADVEIEFALSTRAPDGTCFSGVTITESPNSYNNGSINGSDQADDVMM